MSKQLCVLGQNVVVVKENMQLAACDYQTALFGGGDIDLHISTRLHEAFLNSC